MNTTDTILSKSAEIIAETETLQREIKNRTSKFKKNLKELSDHRKYLVDKLDDLLEMKKHKKDGTFLDFLNNQFELDELISKNLFEDFLFLFKDSLNQYRSIYPVTFLAFKIMDQQAFTGEKEESGVKKLYEYEEDDDLVSNITEASMKKKNWSFEFSKAEYFTFATEEQALIRPTFIYMSNLRKVSSLRNVDNPQQAFVQRMNDISVFFKTKELTKEFEIRDRIVEIINLSTKR